jgi:hypothetical protein
MSSVAEPIFPSSIPSNTWQQNSSGQVADASTSFDIEFYSGKQFRLPHYRGGAVTKFGNSNKSLTPHLHACEDTVAEPACAHVSAKVEILSKGPIQTSSLFVTVVTTLKRAQGRAVGLLNGRDQWDYHAVLNGMLRR